MKKAKWVGIALSVIMIASMSVAAEKHDSAVLVVDVSGTVGDEGQLSGGVKLLRDMNSRFPDYVQSAGVFTFGNQERPQLRWELPVADYNESSVDSSLAGLKEGRGPTPVGVALHTLAPGVEQAKGKTALIIISDGQNTGATDPVKKIKAMKKKHGSNMCVFTIQMGDDEDGAELLGDLVSAGKCGKTSKMSSLQSDSQVQALVDFIFPTVIDSDRDGILDPDDQCPGTPLGAKVDGRGCWVKNITFATGSAEILSRYHDDLDVVVKVLNSNAGSKIAIEGHTDDRGSDENNQALSQKRAEAVMAYLISKGVSASRLSAKGMGESNPIASNNTNDGRAANRRIELTVIK